MNEEKFTGKAALYKKFRPSYPQELLDYLYSELNFSKHSTIADIGAGTGIFTRLLLERGSKVYAIEPNDDMRETSKKDLSKYKNFVSVNTSAENTGLDEASVDFITVAQAFHWFERQLFKQECQRLLKPGGKAVLVWNSKESDSEIIRRNDEIIEKYCVNTGGFKQRGGVPEDYKDFFAGGVCEYKVFRNDMYLDNTGFIGRNLSSSYAPKEEAEPEKYNGYICELNGLFEEYSENGIIHYPQITKSYTGHV